MKDRVEISKRLVLINSISSVATRLLSMSVLIWLQQYLLRRIPAEEYSLLPVLYSVMMFAPLLTAILTGGIGRYIVEAYAKDDDERVSQIVSTMFPILCVSSVFLLAGGWYFAWNIDVFLNVTPEYVWDARVMMALLIFSTAVRLPLSPFGVGLYIRQKFVLSNLIGVGIEVVRLTLLFSLLFGISTRVLWVIIASVSAEMLSLVITTVISRHYVPVLRFRMKHIKWSISRELTTFGGWSFLGTLANTIRMALDPILLNKYATPVDVTTYHVGTMAYRQLNSLALAARGAVDPVLVSMHANSDDRRIRNTYIRVGRYGLWGILFFCVPLMVFSEQVMQLYVGEKYVGAYPLMIMTLAAFFVSYGNVLAPQLASARAQLGAWTCRGMAMHCFNLVCTVAFVVYLELGAFGAVLASFLTETLLPPLLLWPFGLKCSGVSAREAMRHILIPGLLPSFVTAAFLFMLKLVHVPDSWVLLFTFGCLGALVYLAVLRYGVMNEDDKREVEKGLDMISARAKPYLQLFGSRS